ncbi:transglycosylase SLT domain-containing protein [Pseudomonas sp.]|uniref:transglycosylase SLT domain-containing protein n=1 Tax=Pseudomonas sp. TaxID=306 RepID=UPI00273455D4|nr:transglycosylase SLT domain-containing protein [Pseudomonas sp.]MDP3817237.1 transglycosylase SLT domain-containing protein [Pseudomonas sp.]
MQKPKPLATGQQSLTPVTETKPASLPVDDAARLREIRKLVEANNQSSIDTDSIICQIYMESRFDANARAQGSSAKGLMQLLKAPVRELYRLENLKKPRADRLDETDVYKEADKFHASAELTDQATNIKIGTQYLEHLIQRQTKKGAKDPIAEAYKDYRGLKNGIYYNKIKATAEKLKAAQESMQILRDMVK